MPSTRATTSATVLSSCRQEVIVGLRACLCHNCTRCSTKANLAAVSPGPQAERSRPASLFDLLYLSLYSLPDPENGAIPPDHRWTELRALTTLLSQYKSDPGTHIT